MPVQGGYQPPEINELIPFGRRWNSLYEQVKENRSLDKETLRFQARVLCKPPLEKKKENDLLNMLEKIIEQRAGQELDNGETLEEKVSNAIAKTLAAKWIYRLPDKEWYKYTDGHWSTNDGACYEIINDIEDELVKIKGKETPINRKRMGTLQFRRLMEDCIKQRLYKIPKPLKGSILPTGSWRWRAARGGYYPQILDCGPLINVV